MYKYFIYIFFIGLSLSTFAQDDYEDDLEFKSFNKKKKTKSFEGKRKFNIHLEAGYTLSTIFGQGVAVAKDSLEAIKNRFQLDSYNIAPNFSPYGAINLSFNFSKRTSLTLGLKYNNLGWDEIAKVTSNNFYLRYRVKYNFHYISPNIAFQVHANKHVSVYAGHTFSILVKNDLLEKEVQVYNGDTIVNTKQKLDFFQTTGVKSNVFTPQIFLGGHFGIDRFRFNLNFTFSPNFIRGDIYYNNFSVDAGIIFKIFKDYDN